MPLPFIQTGPILPRQRHAIHSSSRAQHARQVLTGSQADRSGSSRDPNAKADADTYPGSLTLDLSRRSFTFKYTSADVSDHNWIGIYYAYGGGPDHGHYVQDSLAWAWAPSRRGSVSVSTEKLRSGTYKAYLLFSGGYRLLAKPLVVNLGCPSDLALFTDSFTTHNARQGEPFTANVGNLVNRAGDPNTRFSTPEADCWASVDIHGIISGRPPADARDTTLCIRVENSGAAVTLPVRIPVRQRGQPLVRTLRVLSFNIWVGGQPVRNHHEKQIRCLARANLDVVALQESGGGHAIRLARALGWHSWQGPDVAVITRYPIVAVLEAPDRAGAVRIRLDGTGCSDVVVWNCHLGYDPYGPYDFCFDHMSVDEVMKREAQSGRTPQITAIMEAMKDSIAEADSIPVFLTGDFNAPSHLDWIDATKHRHCGTGYTEWPTSKLPTEAGLVDAYRAVHPDPVTKPGITWSPIYLDNNGRKEPMDRIDFVYHKGRKLTVQDARALVVGNPMPQPDHEDNEWPSDHKAVLAVYEIEV
ncbi:exonuclease III [Cordyceps militaris CM01]|uniref:Exonuclease III n=1 Tax=Cordyceps militaris (strain CM01) TaxID=983644 RepID=G3JTC4_CORMM|nr:exonuclease III [Cordyceps militaris CM01]EGX88271.1 exonuclease III [Cordyceps militaris CM01]